MLRFNRQELEVVDQGSGAGGFSVQALIQVFRRQRWIIAGVAGATVGAAALYAALTTPIYMAEAQLLIDSSQSQAFAGVGGISEFMDAGMVDSQVEIIKSERIAKAAIKELKQRDTDDKDKDKADGFSAGALLSTVFPFLFHQQPLSDFEQERREIELFSKALGIRRIGRSFVIALTFESPDPTRAADAANQVAESYIVDQLESKFQATRRASVWLQERITELRDQSVAADRAVQEFKIQHDMVDTGKGGLVSDQQLGELNSQLLAARTNVAEAKARFERVQEIIKQGNATGFTDEVVSDVLKSDVVSRLRGQLLDTQKRMDEWSKRYGAEHVAVVNLKSEVEGLKRALFSELNRIAETYRSDLDIAKAREASLNASFDQQISRSKKNSRAQVDLRELESTAETYRSLYENFLQRFMQATQQQSFPITEARVITDASAPLHPSKPRTKLIVFAGLLLGLAMGAGVGYWREWNDRTFRQPSDVEQYLGIDCLGVLPRVPGAPAAAPAGPRRSAFISTAGVLRQVVSEPLSRFTETLRSVKVSADISIIGSAIKVIGFTSTLPKEGKSTVAANFAQLVAHSGSKCILVDCDLRNPTLTRNLAPEHPVGLLELLSGSATLEEASVVDPVTGLRFVPAVVPRQLVHTHEIVGSEQLKRTIDSLKQYANYIIVDLPPLAPIIDTVASAHFVDGYVYLLDWGASNRDLVVNTLKNSRPVYEKILGALINKVDLASLRRLENYGSAYHYYKYHAEYGEQS